MFQLRILSEMRISSESVSLLFPVSWCPLSFLIPLDPQQTHAMESGMRLLSHFIEKDSEAAERSVALTRPQVWTSELQTGIPAPVELEDGRWFLLLRASSVTWVCQGSVCPFFYAAVSDVKCPVLRLP